MYLIIFSVCYSNDTVEVTNPDPSTFTHAMAVQDEGSTSATKCSVSASGAAVIITGCSKVGIADTQRGFDVGNFTYS